MIVLDRLLELKKKHLKLLQKLAMDVLRALASPNMQIRSKVLNLALELVTPNNIQEVNLPSPFSSFLLLFVSFTSPFALLSFRPKPKSKLQF